MLHYSVLTLDIASTSLGHYYCAKYLEERDSAASTHLLLPEPLGLYSSSCIHHTTTTFVKSRRWDPFEMLRDPSWTLFSHMLTLLR
jgi:hypothetical protein